MSGTKVTLATATDDEAIINGHKNVAVAGTAECLVAAATHCYVVLIQAKLSNTFAVYVGGAGVPNTNQGGIGLTPGQSITIDVNDLQKVYVNSVAGGEGVTYIAWQA